MPRYRPGWNAHTLMAGSCAAPASRSTWSMLIERIAPDQSIASVEISRVFVPSSVAPGDGPAPFGRVLVFFARLPAEPTRRREIERLDRRERFMTLEMCGLP